MNSNVLKDLKPYEVFKYFEEIAQIPRGSGNEKGISDYLVAFAKENNLEVIQDEALNVIIRKPGTLGYENAPTVILQGHMDMVNEKNQDTVHDFDKDPLKLRIEGDMVYATGTTLGADNGIAVAFAMAVLASKDIAHPPIEALITTAEETGMDGAVALNPANIKGRTLINIDSEEEGKLLVSCSGGVRSTTTLKVNWVPMAIDTVTCAVRVRGLKGGHSGMEIHKGRGNSNKIMGRFLSDLKSTVCYDICALNGGSKSNAIPREADVTLVVKENEIEKIKGKVASWNAILKNEFKTSDPGVNIEAEVIPNRYDKMFSKDTTEKAVELLMLIPNGIQTMSMDIAGLVQSSTNLGVVTTTANEINYDSAIRSSVKSLKVDIVNQSKMVSNLIGADFNTQADYPDWEYDPNSKIRKVFEDVYKKLNNKAPEIVAIHAGVECGLFKEKFGEIDMISFGPDLFDVHTPNEHFNIGSIERSWNYLLAVLKELK